MCTCAVAHLVVEIQAMIHNAVKVRRLSSKFKVDTCKTKNLFRKTAQNFLDVFHKPL